MNSKAAAILIARELKDLDVPKQSPAYKLVFEQALAAADIMTSRELKQYIVEYLENLPGHTFETESY